jgi:hypothetical protein
MFNEKLIMTDRFVKPARIRLQTTRPSAVCNLILAGY